MEIENLPESLKIKNKPFITCLNGIKEGVIRIWKGGQVIPHYTNHGIEHSNEIIKYLGKILQDHPNLLNETERFVLLASAYLHDIGMQFPEYAGLPKKAINKYTDEELEKIREKHHIASAKIIKNIASGADPELSELIPVLMLKDCKNFVDFITDVSKYHTKLKIKDLKEAFVLGRPMRSPLLAALLRLADTLDRTFQRVNMARLTQVDIPVKSKFIWWGHWYCQSVEVEKGVVKLYFRFPEKYKKTDIEDVFKDRLRRAIEDDYNAVYDVLYKYDIRLYKEVKIEEPNYSGTLEPLPEEVEEYINKEILSIRKQEKRLGERTGVVFYADGIVFSEYKEVKRCISNLLAYAEKEEWKECVQIIKDCETLTMPLAPVDRMILYLNSGNVFYILGMLNDAKRYYENILKFSKRERIQEVYKDETIRVKGATLGNIGLIYRAKGEFDEALKYLEEALKIDREIGYRQGVANQLGNIGLIYRAKGEFDEALKYHQEALKIDREIGYRQGVANQLGNIGLIYADKGEFDEALKYFKEALKIHREIGYRQGVASDLGNIGLIYRAKGEFDEALKYLEEALKIHREIGYRQGVASDLGNIGLIYADKGEFDEALKYHQEALKIDREIGYRQGVANQLGNIGLIYADKGEFDEALKYHQEALKIHREIGYRQGVASDLGNIGLIYRAKGEFDEALKYFKEALKIHREIGYRQGEANHLGNIGLIYADKGEIDEALKYFKEALKIDREIGYRQGVASDLGNIGLIYADKGEFDEALKYFKEALKIHREIGYRQGVASDLGNIGLIYRAKGEFDEALKYLEEALKIHREIGYRQGEANHLGNIGLIYADKGEFDEALKYFKEALKIDREIGYRQGVASDLGNIGLIYRAKGEFDEALKYFKEALKIHREIGYRQGVANQLGNIGLIYRAKGEIDEALKYLEEALKIHREIGYRQGVANQLGNIGLIYRAKGEFDEALKYLEDALKIFMEIKSSPLVIQTLINIADIHFEKGFSEDGFKYLGMAISGASSSDESNKAFSAFLRTLRNLIARNDWRKIEAINVIYKSKILKDENFLNFLKAIREYALWKETSEPKHKSNYERIKQELPKDVRTLLKDLIEKG